MAETVESLGNGKDVAGVDASRSSQMKKSEDASELAYPQRDGGYARGTDGEVSEILLKGTGYGVRMIFPEGKSEDALLEDIRKFSEEYVRLTRGIGVALDFQGRTVSRAFLVRLLSELVWPAGLRVLSWMSYDADALDLFRASGLTTGEPSSERRERHDAISKSLVLMQSLRSGQRVEHDGDVVLLGHINEGAELYASGNVFVRGRLKGVVHAGMHGGECCISAGQFEARQIRLGGKLCSSLGSDMDWWGKAVVISLENDSLVVRELKL